MIRLRYVLLASLAACGSGCYSTQTYLKYFENSILGQIEGDTVVVKGGHHVFQYYTTWHGWFQGHSQTSMRLLIELDAPLLHKTYSLPSGAARAQYGETGVWYYEENCLGRVTVIDQKEAEITLEINLSIEKPNGTSTPFKGQYTFTRYQEEKP